MTEQLQKALVDFLGTLTSSLTDLSGQIPELVQQLVSYNLLTGSLYAILLILISVLFTFSSFKVYLSDRKDLEKDPQHEGMSGLICFLAIIALISFMGCIKQIAELVQLYWFPKVWILDYLKELRNAT